MKKGSVKVMAALLTLTLASGLYSFAGPACGACRSAQKLFLSGTAPALFLDTAAPSDTKAAFVDSAPLPNRTTWKDIGTWELLPAEGAVAASLGDLRVWLGLVSGEDLPANFDLRARIVKNGDTLMAESMVSNIRGLSPDPDRARLVIIGFKSAGTDFGLDDTLGVVISAKVAASGGHNHSSGLRLYYGSAGRPSGLD